MIKQLSSKTCLVTGASGFIGNHLCKELKKHGAKVKALYSTAACGKWDEQIICRLGEDTIPSYVLRDIDIVFHLAGYAHSSNVGSNERRMYQQTNVNGTHDLLLAATKEGVNKFIYFSSVKAMGEESDKKLDEGFYPNPSSLYGMSKLEAERLVLECEKIDSSVVIRLPIVYGAGEKGNLYKMIQAISNDRFPPLPKIDNRRSMIHVDDVVQGSLLAATNQNSSGNVYILTDEVDYSTRKIYELICTALGKKIPNWHVPKFVFYLTALFGLTMNHLIRSKKYYDLHNFQKLFGSAFYSCEKAKKELGFFPKQTLASTVSSLIPDVTKK